MDTLKIPFRYSKGQGIGSDDMFDQKLEEYYMYSYQQCVEWFGKPPDAGRSIFIGYGNPPSCQRVLFGAAYIITLPTGHVTWEPMYGIFAHEIFHRVTALNKVIKETLWLRELLALLVQDKILRMRGFDSYADYLRLWYKERQAPLSVAEIFRDKPSETYPEGFHSELVELGLWAVDTVGWSQICRIAKCDSLQSWASSLDTNSQSILREKLPV